MRRIKLYAKLQLTVLYSRLRQLFLGQFCTGVLVFANDVKLVCPVDDVGVARRLAFNGQYDPHYLKLYLSFLNSDSRVLIVGTHIGAILLPIAKQVHQVVGVEANPRTFEFLQMNVLINGLENCELHNVAASDSESPLDFVMSTVNSGGAKVMPKNMKYEFMFDDPDVIQVKGVRLDDIIEGPFDLVVMDIEGAEYSALQGMQIILANTKVVVCELLPNHLINVSGVSFDSLMSQFPDVFNRFSLTSNPLHCLERDAAGELYDISEQSYYYGGTDLIAQRT